jgi:hypothetical protein
VVPASLPLGNQGSEQLVHERCDGERHPVLPARRQSDPQVLAVILDLAARSEVVGEELLSLDLHDLVGGETA